LHYSSSSTLTTFFFFHFSRHPLPLHSFPTRRSSDLSDALKILLSKINNDRIKVNKVRPYVNHRIGLFCLAGRLCIGDFAGGITRSEEHTSELQSRFDLVCRLLLEKKNKNSNIDKRDK